MHGSGCTQPPIRSHGASSGSPGRAMFDGENMYMGMNDNAQEFLSANQSSSIASRAASAYNRSFLTTSVGGDHCYRLLAVTSSLVSWLSL
ncbi:TOX high mobility group box family member 2 [Grus japonensis]|uniref:TOX high mobility group box family member 2 n=1 Tax=Grus japonensis TaxID=30415 RepID=A0ABC9XI74_GRUJA